MAKSDDDDPPGRYFAAPEPPTDRAEVGLRRGRELAQCYQPETSRLAAAIAFGDSNATVWTRLQAARLLAQIAGAVPEAIPEAPQPGGDGGARA